MVFEAVLSFGDEDLDVSDEFLLTLPPFAVQGFGNAHHHNPVNRTQSPRGRIVSLALVVATRFDGPAALNILQLAPYDGLVMHQHLQCFL